MLENELTKNFFFCQADPDIFFPGSYFGFSLLTF